MTRVKICGITRLEDALCSAELGADALGFIFFEGSSRFIHPGKAREIIRNLPPYVSAVGVFVDETAGRVLEIMEFCGLDRVQLHGGNDSDYGAIDRRWVIRGHRIRTQKDILKAEKSVFFPLLDSYAEGLHGGTGKQFNWDMLRKMKRPFILAGGLNADNIEEAIKLRPYALDVASGVEKSPGVKDRKKLFEFFRKLGENQTE